MTSDRFSLFDRCCVVRCRSDPELGVQPGDLGGDVLQRHHLALGVAQAAAGRDALEDAALCGRPLAAQGSDRDAGQHQ